MPSAFFLYFAFNCYLFLFFATSSASMDKIKPLKNFTMSRENMRATLEAFRAGRSVADVTREVFQAISPPVAGRITFLALASSRALVHASKGSSRQDFGLLQVSCDSIAQVDLYSSFP